MSASECNPTILHLAVSVVCIAVIVPAGGTKDRKKITEVLPTLFSVYHLNSKRKGKVLKKRFDVDKLQL